ncbi:MAG: hypothetical protein IJT36_01655 [Alphaproteobacteria bacterium]|nr:hypothetical protein [Alphaproteobacteria bacterium]
MKKIDVNITNKEYGFVTVSVEDNATEEEIKEAALREAEYGNAVYYNNIYSVGKAVRKYIFKTNTTMKDYNYKKWWIDGDYVREICVSAKNISEALRKYREIIAESECYVSISDNALKCKDPMYIDTPEGPKQTGYVITGMVEMQADDGHLSKQYVDLWVEVLTVIDTDFKEE